MEAAMSLYQQWNEWIQGQNDETFDAFWEKYSSAETQIYRDILKNYPAVPQGILGDLAEQYEVEPALYMGFLDGINSSLRAPLPLETYDETSAIRLEIVYETLLFHMFAANADYLYGLEEWDRILTKEQREEIYSRYRRSRTVVKDPKIGRNDPCPCGSGKKYKKCCGKNV
jgi:hypothetical protein